MSSASNGRAAKSETSLVVDRVSSGYHDLQVLREVSVAVRPGQVELVLGRNGAGKSTLVQVVAGLLPVWDGAVTMAGENISRLPAHARAKRGLAVVLEGRRIFRARTVRENLLLSTYARGLSRQVCRERLDSVIEQLPMLGLFTKRIAGSLSGGQQQMLAIGQALMGDPRYLILDEPSAGLAPAAVEAVIDLLAEIGAQGRGIMLIEQIVDRVRRVADHVTVLDDGVVVAEGDADIVADIRVLRSAYFGSGTDAR